MSTEASSPAQVERATKEIALPDDLQLLKQIILQQHEQLVSAQRTIEQLEHRLDLLLRRIYGPRSESVDPKQMALFAALPDEQPASQPAAEASAPPAAGATNQAAAKPNGNGHGRRRFPENLPRRRKVLDIPEAEKTCPCCGKQRRVIGEVVSERLGFDPAQFYVAQTVQLKYGCTCEQSGVVTAEKPIAPIEKGNAEPDLLAFVAVGRFDDHSPYYRQEHGRFRRAGLDIPRSTQCDWMRQVGELCLPLRDLMRARLLQSYFMGTDDTTVPLLVPGRGKTQEAHIWAYRGDRDHPYNVFDFTVSHSHAGPLRFLRRDAASKVEDGFRGYLQADAGSSYDPLFRQCRDLIEVGCWAHTRRKFFEAKNTNLAVGMEALARVQFLYEVEDRAKEMSAVERLALRQEQSLPLLASLKTWLDEQYAKVLPKSEMGGAIGYALGNWRALCRYTENGELPIDNNAVERMLKLIALGRKNWLFAGSERGGKTAAVLFTLISSAKRHKLNTWAYLRDVMERLADLKPRELEELLPDRWKDSHGTGPPK